MCSYGHKRQIVGEYECPICFTMLDAHETGGSMAVSPIYTVYCPNKDCDYERIEE